MPTKETYKQQIERLRAMCDPSKDDTYALEENDRAAIEMARRADRGH